MVDIEQIVCISCFALGRTVQVEREAYYVRKNDTHSKKMPVSESETGIFYGSDAFVRP